MHSYRLYMYISLYIGLQKQTKSRARDKTFLNFRFCNVIPLYIFKYLEKLNEEDAVTEIQKKLKPESAQKKSPKCI